MTISQQKAVLSRDYALLLFRITSRVLHGAHHHRQHCRVVPPGYKPQSIPVSHWGRPITMDEVGVVLGMTKCSLNVWEAMKGDVFMHFA